jgi:hypothetical protein
MMLGQVPKESACKHSPWEYGQKVKLITKINDRLKSNDDVLPDNFLLRPRKDLFVLDIERHRYCFAGVFGLK